MKCNIKQGVALTGRNTTGPPHAVPRWVTLHMRRYNRRQTTTTDNDRRPQTTTDDRDRYQSSHTYTVCRWASK